MPYIDKVLSSFKEKGIKTVEQARSTAPVQKGAVTAQKYQQRSYTEEELSRSALDLLKEAEKDNE
jgi:DNA replication protein DnaD